MPILAQATTRWDGATELRFPYHPGLIEALKLSIPAHAREWNPGSKTWIVSAAYTPIGVRLLRDVFPDATISGDRTAPPPPRPPEPLRPSDRLFAALHLQPTAPPELVLAAFKCLAKLHHPDRAPIADRDRAHRAMIETNNAYDEIRDRASA